MLAPVRTIAPAALVTAAEAKARVPSLADADDAVVTALLDAATARLDGWSGILGRALGTQTWRQDFHCFRDCLRLPLAPVQSVTKIEYYDGSNAKQTLDASAYALLADARGAFLSRNQDATIPGTYDRPDAVSVTYVAGYDDVPAPIIMAIMLLASGMYTAAQINGGLRSFEVTGAFVEQYNSPDMIDQINQGAVASLIAPYRRVGL